jgi:hypothetical protein
MVILKTPSQLRSFIHRKSKHLVNYDEGCGCCYNHSWITFDSETDKVLEHNEYGSGKSHQEGGYTQIIAIYREKRIEIVT